jgi:DNA-binding HxlR family transcriptional regulator
MPKRITDPVPAKIIQSELKDLIAHTQKFSERLHQLLVKHDIDVAGERAATVEVLKVILQKWVIEILHVLFIYGQSRFNDIKRNLKGISSRTLTSKLRLLEDQGFVERNQVSERPTVVEYSLTMKGKTLAELSAPIILFLKLGSLKTE